jgi:hypothetical protein
LPLVPVVPVPVLVVEVVVPLLAPWLVVPPPV